MADEIQQIQQVVSRYHRAIAEKDQKTAVGCIGPTYFRAGRMGKGGASDPTAWVAGDFSTPEGVRKSIARAFGSAKSVYANSIEFLHTSVGKNAALVVTRETGSGTGPKGQTGSWKGVTNLWCMAKVRGRWKIVASLHHVGKGRVTAGA